MKTLRLQSSTDYDCYVNPLPGVTKVLILIDWAEQLGIDDPLGHSVCRALTRVVANWTKAYETVNQCS
jgi:hypothetical protein